MRVFTHLFCVTFYAWRYPKNFGAIQILGQFRTFEEILAVVAAPRAEKSAWEAPEVKTAISPLCFDESQFRDHFCQPPWGGPKSKSGLGIALSWSRNDFLNFSQLCFNLEQIWDHFPTDMGGPECKSGLGIARTWTIPKLVLVVYWSSVRWYGVPCSKRSTLVIDTPVPWLTTNSSC